METRGWVGLPPDPDEDVYVDFYQVTRTIGDRVAVRRMALKPVSGGIDNGVVVPIPGRFIKSTRIAENKAGEIIRELLCNDWFGTHVRMAERNYEDLRHPIDESYALLWDGTARSRRVPGRYGSLEADLRLSGS